MCASRSSATHTSTFCTLDASTWDLAVQPSPVRKKRFYARKLAVCNIFTVLMTLYF